MSMNMKFLEKANEIPGGEGSKVWQRKSQQYPQKIFFYNNEFFFQRNESNTNWVSDLPFRINTY